jgi:hypothetical protein
MGEGDLNKFSQMPTEPLSFEEFAKRGGNFHLYFAPIGTMMGDMYRKNEVYQKALSARPELQVLAAELQGYDFEEFDIDEATGAPIIKEVDPKRDEMLRKLYDAYLIMRQYAKRDGELFG